jgi:pyridoxal phosphate enzyme (YggS family)
MGLTEIQDNIARVEAQWECAGRTRLIAVSKVQPDDRLAAVLDQGHRCFGENRVQEAAGKWPAFREIYGEIDLHLIGPLQSNKARQAFELFNVIHTLDRPKLATTFARLADEMGHCPDMLIQVNTGREDQKAGVLPEEVDDFVRQCQDLSLPVKGLMCIPPVDEEASLHFALLDKMAARNGVPWRSMGMSSDYDVAISLGATHVRVGSAIFGERVASPQ